MVSFRRWITALAVLALFAGLASAQVTVPGGSAGATFACTAYAAQVPTLRTEGMTELAADIVIQCTGGTALAPGTAIPTVNLIVSFNTGVTSRLLSFFQATPVATYASNTSEALLLIDEPGSNVYAQYPQTVVGAGTVGYGPLAAQTLCAGATAGTPASAVGATAGLGGCPEYAAQLGGADFVASTSSTSAVANAPNVFAGVASANQVQFYGIPVMPPASAGVARFFRITNIRVNANTLGGGLAGVSPVVASVAVNNASTMPLSTTVLTVGYLQPGLSASVRTPANLASQSAVTFNQCSTQSVVTPLAVLRYTENFGTAFKTRVVPTATTNGQSSSPSPAQNIPGMFYESLASESGLVFGGITGTSNGITAGLTDYGTRLRAVFNSIPTGVRIFVSTTNVVNILGTVSVAPPAGNAQTSFAQLVYNDTGVDGNGSVANVPPTGYTTFSSSNSNIVVGYAEIIPSATGSATAIWEVINDNPTIAENFDFGVFIAYNASPNSSPPSPPAGVTATVNMNFAPVSTTTTASSSATIPRFADMSSAISMFSLVPCATSLLFPFITNQAGFDTGVALMNTSTDPFGTGAQAGNCTVYFYGTPVTAAYTTPVIGSGNAWTVAAGTFQASAIAPGFEGYAIAVCNFQMAHGYAFVSDLGAHNLAHGYLALVLTNTNPLATKGRSPANPETLTH